MNYKITYTVDGEQKTWWIGDVSKEQGELVLKSMKGYKHIKDLKLVPIKDLYPQRKLKL